MKKLLLISSVFLALLFIAIPVAQACLPGTVTCQANCNSGNGTFLDPFSITAEEENVEIRIDGTEYQFNATAPNPATFHNIHIPKSIFPDTNKISISLENIFASGGGGADASVSLNGTIGDLGTHWEYSMDIVDLDVSEFLNYDTVITADVSSLVASGVLYNVVESDDGDQYNDAYYLETTGAPGLPVVTGTTTFTGERLYTGSTSYALTASVTDADGDTVVTGDGTAACNSTDFNVTYTPDNDDSTVGMEVVFDYLASAGIGEYVCRLTATQGLDSIFIDYVFNIINAEPTVTFDPATLTYEDGGSQEFTMTINDTAGTVGEDATVTFIFPATGIDDIENASSSFVSGDFELDANGDVTIDFEVFYEAGFTGDVVSIDYEVGDPGGDNIVTGTYSNQASSGSSRIRSVLPKSAIVTEQKNVQDSISGGSTTTFTGEHLLYGEFNDSLHGSDILITSETVTDANFREVAGVEELKFTTTDDAYIVSFDDKYTLSDDLSINFGLSDWSDKYSIDINAKYESTYIISENACWLVAIDADGKRISTDNHVETKSPVVDFTAATDASNEIDLKYEVSGNFSEYVNTMDTINNEMSGWTLDDSVSATDGVRMSSFPMINVKEFENQSFEITDGDELYGTYSMGVGSKYASDKWKLEADYSRFMEFNRISLAADLSEYAEVEDYVDWGDVDSDVGLKFEVNF